MKEGEEMSRKENILGYYSKEIAEIKAASLYKEELPITSMQGRSVTLADGRQLLNMCANNYLGLCDHPQLIQAAKDTYDAKGYGMSSVRFICGTQDIHKELEQEISRFFGMEDTILYAASMPTGDCSRRF